MGFYAAPRWPTQASEAEHLQESIAKGIICPKITLSTPLLFWIADALVVLLLGGLL